MKKRKIVFYLLGIVALAVALSLFAISAAADALALKKRGDETAITLGEDVGVIEFSRVLKDNGIINMPLVFDIYAALRNKTEFHAGEYTFSADMSYDEIFIAASGKKERRQIKITIPDGMRTDEIIDVFVSNGIGTREGFVAALCDDYGYDYIPQKPDGRTYRYDGYLYPDTYFFYSDSSEHAVVSKLLHGFDTKFSDKLRALAQKNGMSIDECVTLASVIQREAFYTAEMGALSSVLHNRLHSRTLRRLECDSTVGYAWFVGEYEGDFLSVPIKSPDPIIGIGAVRSLSDNKSSSPIQTILLVPELHRFGCPKAVCGLYRQWGIAPRPEDLLFNLPTYYSICPRENQPPIRHLLSFTELQIRHRVQAVI